MFGVSFPELVTIAIVVLVAFGPDKLPGVARTMGRLFAELRRQSDALKREMRSVIDIDKDLSNSIKEELRPIQRELVAVKNEIQSPSTKETL